MKKTSLLAAVPAIAFSALLLSGCGLFHSRKAWQTAEQESPLEIPPGLDRPSTSAALVIPPPGANAPTANNARAGAGADKGQVSDGFVLTDAVDVAYQRVGDALKAADLGQIVSHDDAAHSYTVDVKGVAAQQQKRGLFARMFHRGKSGESASASHQVSVVVGSNGSSGSEVRVQGGAAAVGKVVDSLKSRLGG